MPPDQRTADRTVGGYPCRVACLLCDPAPVLETLDQLALHYIRAHPLLKTSVRVVRLEAVE